LVRQCNLYNNHPGINQVADEVRPDLWRKKHRDFILLFRSLFGDL
jgi:hypothetical protein